MKHSRGFTLVELMVSIGVFAVVVSMTAGAYLIMIGLNREAQAQATGINNLSFALDTMTRTIRTGRNYSGAGSSLQLTAQDGSTVTYQLSGSTIMQTISNGSGSQTLALTDPSLIVTTLNFTVNGPTNADLIQANVTIVVAGTVNVSTGKTRTFNIETGATMRKVDL